MRDSNDVGTVIPRALEGRQFAPSDPSRALLVINAARGLPDALEGTGVVQKGDELVYDVAGAVTNREGENGREVATTFVPTVRAPHSSTGSGGDPYAGMGKF